MSKSPFSQAKKIYFVGKLIFGQKKKKPQREQIRLQFIIDKINKQQENHNEKSLRMLQHKSCKDVGVFKIWPGDQMWHMDRF